MSGEDEHPMLKVYMPLLSHPDLSAVREMQDALKEAGVTGIGAKTETRKFILESNMSDHSLRTQIQLVPNSMFHHGNSLMKFL